MKKSILPIILMIAVLLSWLGTLDQPALIKIDTGLKRALVTFASARAMNAAISVVQGTELSVTPLGMGITLKPGQILDPVNDLVEQFSNLMLIASVAFGIQKVLILVSSYWLISVALTLVTMGWGYYYFRNQKIPNRLSSILLLLLMMRFAIPMIVLGTDFVFNKFLANEYVQSQSQISNAPAVMTDILEPDPDPQEKSVVPSAKVKEESWWSQTKKSVQESVTKTQQNIDIKGHLKTLQTRAELWTINVINLIVVFLLQTLVLPLLLLWLMYSVSKSLIKSG